jgi:gamma-glutamyltranspeptidase/glutathione hydrolase
VAVATTSQLAADAAAEVAELGGNAVDCAIAAAMVAMNTQPGVCSIAGAAYITIWHPGENPLTIDGGVAVPGRNPGGGYAPDDGVRVQLDYGGGIETVVGCASVAVPGALAACDRAIERFGSLPWSEIVAPAARITREGFPLPSACHYFLEYAGRPVYCRSADGERALFTDEGALRDIGDTVIVPHLADSLDCIAEDGVRAAYEGWLARALVDHCRDGGGALTAADLSEYVPVERPALVTGFEPWSLAVNPPPAVGGAVLTALLLLCRDIDSGTPADSRHLTARIIDAQIAALGFRKQHLDLSDEIDADVRRLLAMAESGNLLGRSVSAATVHTSAVDSAGLGCSITASAGYGSGEMPPGTGLWLNNCLGELELNRRGLRPGAPGMRLPSNMAPGVARTGDAVLAFGSPGADRITTALQQFLLNHLLLGMDLDAANRAPRLHVETGTESPRLSVEGDQDLPDVSIPVRRHPANSMYFGGVGVARADRTGELSASADPRRVGGVFVAR